MSYQTFNKTIVIFFGQLQNFVQLQKYVIMQIQLTQFGQWSI